LCHACPEDTKNKPGSGSRAGCASRRRDLVILERDLASVDDGHATACYATRVRFIAPASHSLFAHRCAEAARQSKSGDPESGRRSGNT
jgi:hypothetical protein